jgi:hypothetical protein
MRSARELIEVAEPAWPVLRERLLRGPARVEVLPVAPDDGVACLYRLQVTARSCLGALALRTGGVLVDHGWVRVLGGGSAARGLPGLADANGLPVDPREVLAPPPALLVGYDVLGGRFAVNGPDPAAVGRPGRSGDLCYFAPDTLSWEPMGMGHGAWLSWLVSGSLDTFYEGLRWPGWREDVAGLALDQGISVVPFLWSGEAEDDIAASSRAPVPIAELDALHEEFRRQFSDDVV